jgi:hypothetical protein
VSGKGAAPFVSSWLAAGTGETPGVLMANLLLPGRPDPVVLVPVPNTPANSPRWTHTQGPIAVRVAQNTETGIFAAVAHVVGKPYGAGAEGTDHVVALRTALDTLVNGIDNATPQDLRAITVSAAERDEFAALRDAT